MYIVLEPNTVWKICCTFLWESYLYIWKKLNYTCGEKINVDMPVPGKLGKKGSDHTNPCYKNWVKIEEVQSKIILHSALNVDKKWAKNYDDLMHSRRVTVV